MTVSEKHINAAVDLVDSEMFKGLMAVDRIGKCAEMVAEALAAAEREGMRRADLLEQTFRTYNCPRPCNHRPDEFTIGECIDAGECGCSAGVAILAQANTHSVALPPGATEQAGTVSSSPVSATHHASRNGRGE